MEFFSARKWDADKGKTEEKKVNKEEKRNMTRQLKRC